MIPSLPVLELEGKKRYFVSIRHNSVRTVLEEFTGPCALSYLLFTQEWKNKLRETFKTEIPHWFLPNKHKRTS
jgi:hypothetical protein